jgi:hypothetical protein
MRRFSREKRGNFLSALCRVRAVRRELFFQSPWSYSNGEQAEACEAKGILPHVPANRGVNSRGDGTLFDRTEFTYQTESDTFLCPARQTLARKQLMR